MRSLTNGLTRTRAIVGTPQYMSPEQARGLTNEIDARTDQFALGVIAYELLAGRPPFHAEDPASVLYQVVHEQPPGLLAAGVIADPAGKEGTAHLAFANVDLGTAKRSALEIEAALGDLGTVLTGGAGREGGNLQVEVLSRNADAALGILAEVIRTPAFPQAEFDREKTNLLANLEQQNNNPNAVATRVRGIVAFGREHPYGRPAQGLPSTVASIGRDDVARFWQERVKPGSSASETRGRWKVSQSWIRRMTLSPPATSVEPPNMALLAMMPTG